MKNNKHIILLLISATFICLLFCLFCKYKEQKTELHARSIAEWSLDVALEKELDIRRKNSNTLFICGQLANDSSDSFKRGMEFRSENGTEFIPFDSILKIRETRKKNWEFNAVQTSISKDHPANLQRIDSIFRKELERRNIRGASLIKYTYNGVTSYSSPDTVSISSSIRTEESKSGLKNEVALQAFLRYPLLEHYRNAGTITFFLFICALIFTLYKEIKRRQKKKIETGLEEKDEKEEKEEIVQHIPIPRLDPGIQVEKEGTEIFHVNKDYIFDFNKNFLFIAGEPVCITNQNSITLKALLQAPDFMMKRDDLCICIWGTADIDHRRLYQVIKRIKEDILSHTNLTINCINQNYQLCVDRPENRITRKKSKKQSQPE